MNPLPISEALQRELDHIIRLTNSDRYEAFKYCEAGFAAARAAHDDAAFIAIAIQYGLVIDQHGYPQESIDILYEALQLAQSYHQFHDEARLLNVIGRAVYTRAEYRRAMQAWAHCLEVSALANDEITWIWAKLGIAQIYNALGDNSTAVILVRQAEERARPLNEPILLLNILLNLGVELFYTQQFDQALLVYRESLEWSYSLNHRDDIGEILFRIAEVELEMQDYPASFEHLQEAQVICTQSHHIWALANIHGVRAKWYRLQSQLDLALIEVQQGIDYACASGSSHIEMRLLFLQSQLAESKNDYALAFQALRRASKLKEQINPSDGRQQMAELEDLAGLRPSAGRILLELASSPQLEHCTLAGLADTLCEYAPRIIRQVSASYWEYLSVDEVFVQLSPERNGNQVKFSSPLMQSLQKGETTVAHNAQHHQHTWVMYEQLFQAKKTLSVLIVPLRSNESVYGILMIEYAEQTRNWSSDEVQYMNQLALIGTRVLINIERDIFQSDIARLNAQLQQSNMELENRVVERTIELQKALEHLIETEKLASLGNLVAGFAHELNTPLGNTLTAATTLLEKNHELVSNIELGSMKKSTLVKYLEETCLIAELVERNARRASDLISNLKQVAVDTASSKQRVFSLRHVLDEAIASLGINLRCSEIQIKNDIPYEIELDSYPGSLEQVIVNFINNSLVHGFDGNGVGEISLKARQLNKSQVELSYQDNGSGIPDALKKRVFDPFFTTRFGQGGSGLGLYLVYSLVTGTLGGMIELRDAPSGGVWFVLTLPVQAPAAEHHEHVDLFRH